MRALLVQIVAVAAVAAACAGAEVEADPSVEEPVSVATVAVEATPESSPEPGPEPPVATTEARTITVGGMGSQYAQPDRCVLDVGVTVRRPSVQEATEAASASASALTDALRSAGVADEHIQSSSFAVNPYYDDWPVITGYETTLGYRVTIPDVAIVADVMSQGVDAGGDDVRAWGIRFETDPTGLMAAARDEAWVDVVERAEALAGLMDEPLGDVLDAHEKVLVSTSQGSYQGGQGDSAAFDIPVLPGQAGVVVLLTVTFAIGSV